VHIKELKGALSAVGQASLQNALDVSTDALGDVPAYGLREVMILFAGLSTCDPGEISTSIANAKVPRRHNTPPLFGLMNCSSN
jgi:transcription initiation factor TFIIH subunit 2